MSRHLEQLLLPLPLPFSFSFPSSGYNLHVHAPPVHPAQSPDRYITQHFALKKKKNKIKLGGTGKLHHNDQP